MGLRLMWLGTYERDNPRARVLISGLEELGVEVVECHRPLWELTRHKAGAFLSPARLPLTGLKFARAWGSLFAEQRRLGPVDAIVAGYPGQPDAGPAALCARRRGARLVLDANISFSETLHGDRQRVGSAVGAALARFDRFAVRCADLVMTDTATNAELFVERFGASPARTLGVPVGTDPARFPRAAQPEGRVYALFWAKFSPVHGVETVLEAAHVPGTPPLRLIGDGQVGPWIDAELARRRPPGLERIRWVEYEKMAQEIASASICLGTFGTSEKARRVLPNKIYEAMAVGRPIVTMDTPGAREVLTDGEDAILVPPGEPKALAEALQRLSGDAELRARLGDNAHRRFQEIGTPRAVARQFLDLLSVDGDRG